MHPQAMSPEPATAIEYSGSGRKSLGLAIMLTFAALAVALVLPALH
ncbi:MAG: hypothetical protein JSR59_13970 [Proteobacteria bacterium]|nr:hypothetical protein [Pseudomonadota bacterium]